MTPFALAKTADDAVQELLPDASDVSILFGPCDVSTNLKPV